MKASTYAVPIGANKGASFAIAGLTKPAVEAMIEARIKAAVKGKAKRAIESARTPEAVEVRVRVPAFAKSNPPISFRKIPKNASRTRSKNASSKLANIYLAFFHPLSVIFYPPPQAFPLSS